MSLFAHTVSKTIRLADIIRTIMTLLFIVVSILVTLIQFKYISGSTVSLAPWGARHLTGNVAILFTFLIALSITRPIKELSQVAQEISKGKLYRKAKINSRDEIGKLAESFNKMTLSLMKAKGNIEQKVEQRTSQLERLNKLKIGRELKMMELKKKIKRLQKQLMKKESKS